jgi:hypothetical protein
VLLPNGQFAPRDKSRSGLELEVDTRWSDTYGYRPLRFTFASATPVTGDRQITVRFFIDDVVNHDFSLAVEQDGELPLGQQSVTLTLRAPQLDSWNFIRWDVWVDGVKEPALSLDREHAVSLNRWQHNGLIAYRPVPGSGAPVTVSTSPARPPRTFEVPANRISGPYPADWIDYSCFDYVVVPLDELLAENASHPENVAALRRWLHAGGNLWVEQTGVDLQRLDELSALLELEESTPEKDANAAPTSELPAGWSYVTFKPPVNQNESQRDQNATSAAPEPSDIASVDDPTVSAEIGYGLQGQLAQVPLDSRGWFAERAAGFGTLTAFVSASNKRPSGINRDAQGAAAMRWFQRAWLPRHGLAPNSPNAEFSNLLIPGVGLAPVTEFRVLITLFVLLIGPLNYWLLSRAKRLYLLVLTVPLGAAAVTLLLFCYAFLADGLATQVRARSVTMLDQTSGEAVSWSRLSYYAGFAPADGLSFPNDTALYPILPETPGVSPRSRQPGRVVEWHDQYQDLTQGWLPSRTPTQYLAVRAHQSPAKLEVRSAADRCQAVNQLGAPIDWLMVVDEQGALWHGIEIDVEERIDLEPGVKEELMRQLRETLLVNKPELPLDLQAAADPNRQSMRRGRVSRYGRYRFLGEAGEFRLSGNLLEKKLEGLTEASGGSLSMNLLPRSYLALTSRVVDSPLGLDDAEESASFHVVEGRW